MEKKIRDLIGHKNAVTCVDWHITQLGEFLATCSDDRSVRVYHPKDWSLFHIFHANDLYITYLAIDKTSPKIFATTEDGYVYVFCLEKKEHLHRKQLHAGSVEGLRILIESKADLNIAAADGRTPLQIAQTKQQDYCAKLIEAALEGKALPSPLSENGSPTPKEWEMRLDGGSGQAYYFNRTTGVSQWEIPDGLQGQGVEKPEG